MPGRPGQRSRLGVIDGYDASQPLPVESYEQYCQARNAGAGQADAVRLAGYQSKGHAVYSTASLIERRSDVQARLAWLKLHQPPDSLAAQVEEVVVTKEWLTRKAIMAAKLCEDCGDRANLVKTLSFLAHLGGHMVQKTEVRAGPLDDVPLDDVKLFIAEIKARRDAAEAAPKPKALAFGDGAEAPPIRIIDVDGEEEA